MRPDLVAEKGNEHSHQAAVFLWAWMAANYGFNAANDMGAYAKKELAQAHVFGEPRATLLHLLYAVPNGGERHAAVAAKLKVEGVKKGVPDITLPVACGHYHGLYIEMKKPGITKPSPDQKIIMEHLHIQGYKVVLCDNWLWAVRELMDYILLGKFDPHKYLQVCAIPALPNSGA